MLDTHVFDRVLDGRVPRAWLEDRRLMVTGVQAAELRAVPDVPDERRQRREDLLRVMEEIAPELCVASTFCWGIDGAGFDQAEWNDGSGRFDAMLSRLKSIGRKPKSQDANQIRDIVIAETALKLGATLVTDDAALGQVVGEFGGKAISSAALTREVESSPQSGTREEH